MPGTPVRSAPFSPLTPKQAQPLINYLNSGRKKARSPRGKTPKSLYRSSSFEVVAKDWLATGTTPKKGKKIQTHYDRFIPNREAMDLSNSQFHIAHKDMTKEQMLDSAALAYQEQVAKACGIALDKRILAFKGAPPTNDKEDLRKIYNRPLKTSVSQLSKRKILNAPERVLDAPGLIDDYYLNLLDWSCANIVAIGLDKNIYLWNADTGDVSGLCETASSDLITSLSWSNDGAYLAVGTDEGDTQIWDIESSTKIRSMPGHLARVGVLSWDKHMLSSGCRDGSIWNHDVRIANHKTAELLAHTSEVCGLKWRSDGTQLASGGNDNLVNIWDARSSVPKFTKHNHTAAVKALAWCPWQPNLLATGGGSNDRHIHFWNTTTAARLNSIDTGSQVTSLIWSPEYKEIMSSHGFPDNHISIWNYPSLSKVIDIPAHETRVLHTALSPDGQTVASVASDENLKFWKVFESSGKGTKSIRKEKASESFGYSGMTIR
ncbi:WD repeat-containing protein slp1 [Basidiobolus ranarum]|uniref:WD repeat-containing protein slp1 n=1 Tax=Basidiobolus ranarum TaxID=34480 RepID=A0ABR2X0W6_9FUNG